MVLFSCGFFSLSFAIYKKLASTVHICLHGNLNALFAFYTD